jgi:hypothetical protein
MPRSARMLAGGMLLATAGIQLGKAVMSTRSGRRAVRMAGRGLARGGRNLTASIGRAARRFYGNQYVKLGIGRSRGRGRRGRR